ncbi:hypothetical protein B7P43_G06359, partial [Cryptotermes secundus]
LFYAVTLGHADSTQLLLNFGAEPDRQDRKGRTPAHCGAAKGQLETLRILGTHGANLWVRNVRGDYPLHEAVVSGRKNLVYWLLTQRPDAVNSPNNDGRCPLHIAAVNNNVEMCKILLDNQALLNPVMRTSKGQLMTPIDAALHRGNRGCAKYLQLHGGVPASKLTDKSARVRGGNQRGAMSETQSEQYTTPEFAATLSLPGGRTSLGTSPLAEHAAALNDAGRRTLQVRMNDDVAIRHVEKIDAPLVCTHRRFEDESSGEERMRRRRRRRRRERRKTDYIDDVDREIVEEDSRRRRRGDRDTGGFSDSADSEGRKRRRRRRDDDFSDDWDSERDRRSSRRWRRRGDQGASSERSDEEDADMVDDMNDSNWVRNKKRRGEKIERPKWRSKSKERLEDGHSDVEYVRVKRTTIRSKKTKRKTVTDEEQEEQIEEDSERSSEVEVEEEVVEKQDNSEVTRKMSNSEEVTTTKAETELRRDQNKSKEKLNTVNKVDSRKSKKKESALEKDKRKKPETSCNKETETERKSVERSKRKTNKKIVTKDSSTRQTTEETEGKDTTRQSSVKKVARKGVSQVDALGAPKEVDKVMEIATAKGVAGVRQKGEAHEQPEDPALLLEQEREDGTTRAVVTALVHQHDDEGSTEASRAEEQTESSKNGEPDTEGVSDTFQATGTTEQEQDEAAVRDRQAATEEVQQRFKEGDTERKEKSSEVDEGKGDITQEAEGTNEEKPQTEFGVGKGVQATNEGESEDLISSETGPEAGIDLNDRKEADEDREGNAEVEEETTFTKDSEKTHEEGDQEEADAEKEKAGGGDAESEDKAMIEQVNNGGSPTEEDAQKLEHDINGDEAAKDNDKTDGDSRASTQELTISSPLEKEEGAAREMNTESGASTARSRNGGDSSMLLDSGFEPSPRREKITTRSNSGKQQQTRSARQTRGRGRGRIPRPCRTDGEQPTTTVSVTQAVQRSMRKYHLERRIFQELLELKRLQIRAGRANEQVLVKRLVDDYHKAGLTVGMRQYDGVFTFRNFEKYLYDQLRLLQSSDRRLIPRLKSTDDLEKLTAALRRARLDSAYLDDIPDNPVLCTHGTHRCHHAAHAYTGVPCAAYITKLNHHHAPKSGRSGPSRGSGFLPRIDPSSRGTGRNSSAVPRSLSYVDPSRPVTLELSHGSDKQVISLPTERLDRNKRYYVTFTIKGGLNGSKDGQQAEGSEEETKLRHRHANSL